MTILLIPAIGDPHGLLAVALHAGPPPRAVLRPRLATVDGHVATVRRWSICHTSRGEALALAWRGEVLPEGCDRAARRLAATGLLVGEEVAISATYGLGWVKLLAEACAVRLGGSVVVTE